MSPALRVLYLTSGMPWPGHSGGQLRELQLLRRLGTHVDVHLRVVTPAGEVAPGGCEAMAEHCASVRVYEPCLDPGGPFSGEPALPARVVESQSAALRADVAQLAGRVDVVHLQGYFLLQHVPLNTTDTAETRVPILLFGENVEYLLDRQRQQASMAPAGEAPWTISRRFEHAAWRRATVCVVPSEDMRQRMVADVPGLPVLVSPNGWDHVRPPGPRRSPAAEGGPLTVTFVGNYGWPPSHDAAVYLLECLWPRIFARVPQARLLLVGASPSPRMRSLAGPGVTITGVVPSLAPVLDGTDVFLCPLRVGEGVKMKMVEALSAACAVVSTTIGAQGMPPALRDAFVVTDTTDGLVDATVELLGNPAARHALAARAAAAAPSLPSWDDVAEQFGRYWHDAAGLRQPRELKGTRVT